MILIAPSVLSADFGNLAEQVGEVASVADWIHLDVMDGHFVDNITIGPPVVESLRRHTGLFFDCHLMIEWPEKYISQFKNAGAQLCSVHVESKNPHKAIKIGQDVGLKMGIAVNPGTPLEKGLDFLEDVDLLLIMTVHPGFGGQSFIYEVLEKIKDARKAIELSGKSILIEVDGGINLTTAKLAKEKGADVFVAGSAIYNADIPPWHAAKRLKESLGF